MNENCFSERSTSVFSIKEKEELNKRPVIFFTAACLAVTAITFLSPGNVDYNLLNNHSMVYTQVDKFSYNDQFMELKLTGDIINKKPEFRERYKKISNSDWYKQAYKNMSIGDVMEIVD